MKEPATDIPAYRADLRDALEDTFQRRMLDAFAVDYKNSRERIFADMDEKAAIADLARRRDEAIRHFDALFERFRREAEKRGVTVHLAADAEEANAIITHIARRHKCRKIVKSKSMTAEEIQLNRRLEAEGMEVAESDLGEWIIQLRHEGPSHMVLPAIHLSRARVADVFSDATGRHQSEDIENLVRVARRQLRPAFAEADMGISGANFAIAECGAIGIVTNEGNARLVTTLPRVHVALCGIDKLVESVDDALATLKVLPRNATSQYMTSYVSWISGPAAPAGTFAPDEAYPHANGEGASGKSMHVVFLDNGRSALRDDPRFSEVLRCVRCGACANVCPVYRLVGGHRMGYIYIGAIGLILTYFFHGKDRARALVQNCVNCQACKNVCSAGIDLPGLIEAVRMRYVEEEGASLPLALLSACLKNRVLFHSLLRFARFAQRPLTGGEPFIRHLPAIFAGDQGFRALPAVAETPFRDRWARLDPPAAPYPDLKVALFAGCLQDFVYPEQMEAAVALMRGRRIRADFPPRQSCCGLPLVMMGLADAARDVALQNMEAFASAAGDADVILTLCASCASHLKNGYPALFADDAAKAAQARSFSAKIMDFSSFAGKRLRLDGADFTPSGETVTYHASCHLCRGLGVHEAPRELIRMAARYAPAAEEDVCCGFGGSYSAKFPEISAQLLRKKLDHAAATGATRLVADCPGCILQLRGGAEKEGSGLKVIHIAELLAERLKHKAAEAGRRS